MAVLTVLGYAAIVMHLHGLRGTVVVLRGSNGLSLMRWAHRLDLVLGRRLDGAHGLTEWNWDDLAVANVLEQNLRIADYKRVCNVQLVLQLVAHGRLNIHVIRGGAILEIGRAIRRIHIRDRLDGADRADCTRDHRAFLVGTIGIQKRLLLLVARRESVQSARVVVVDACVRADVFSRHLGSLVRACQ